MSISPYDSKKFNKIIFARGVPGRENIHRDKQLFKHVKVLVGNLTSFNATGACTYTHFDNL